jgi:hypothetical protein
VAIPLAGITRNILTSVESQISSLENSHLIILIDVLSPSLERQDQFRELLVNAFSNRVKVVASLSSSFEIFTCLEAVNSSLWSDFLSRSKIMVFEPWGMEISKSFLCSLLRDEENIDGLVEYCRGIPKLMALCQNITQLKKNDPFDAVRKHEFSVVLSFMKKHNTGVIWKDEIDILVAAKYGLKIEELCLTKEQAEATMMVMSYLVTLENSVPTLYFPVAGYNCGKEEAFDFLTRMVSSIWANITWIGSPKLNSESIIGQYFESEVPHVINRNGSLTLIVQKIHGGLSSINITISLSSPGGLLNVVHFPLPGRNALWKTPKSFKAIDFVAEVDATLPDSDEDSVRVLLAIQVTSQSSNIEQKFRKSLVGMNFDYSKVVFVMLNPKWTDYNSNLEQARSVTAGTAARRFGNVWYGQPVAFEAFKGLLKEICFMFNPSTF